MLTAVDGGKRRLLAALAGTVAATGASAQGGHGKPDETKGGEDGKPSKAEEFAKLPAAEKWRRRFPQPVLVGDLIGRKMLDRNQGVLGHVDAVVTAPDGDLHIAFRRRRLFVLQGDAVVVPNIMAALLGPFVMLPEVSDEEIGKLPAFEPSKFKAVDRDTRIRMALTKH